MDAIVGEYSCHLRASALIAWTQDPAVRKELEGVAQRAASVEALVREVITTPKLSLRCKPLTSANLRIEVDGDLIDRVYYLVAGHLLTCGKVWYYNRLGKETCEIEIRHLKNALHLSREMPDEQVRRVIALAQSRMADLSVQYVRGRGVALFPDAGCLVRRQLSAGTIIDLAGELEHPYPLRCSPTMSNCRVFMEGLRRGRVLVLLSENPKSVAEGRPPEGLLGNKPLGTCS